MVTAHDHPDIEERVVAALRDDLAEVNGRLNVLEVMQRDIATLKLDVGDLKTGQAALRQDVNELKSDVATLKTDVADLKTGQAALRQDVNELKSDVAAILQLLNDLARRLP